MSLTSRLVNLVVPPNQTAHLAPTDGNATVALSGSSQDVGSEAQELAADRDPHKFRAMEAEEIESRPPYLYARLSFVLAVLSWAENELTTLIVYDCWRYWWDHRRSADAFLGYRQDSATRRPAHAPKIHVHVLFIRENLQTRRVSQRSLQRCHTCFSRVFPRHCYFLWYIRVQ